MTAPHGRAIHYPEALFPGAVTRRRSGQAGDPAGVPFRQLIRIPSGIPADTGNPASGPLRRYRPIRTFRRTPRLIQHQACKTIWGRAGDYQVSLILVPDLPGLLPICPLAFRRPPYARPRGARPQAPARRGRRRRGRARLARANVAWAGPPCGRGRPAGRPQPRRRRTPDRNLATANCACGMRGHSALFPRNPEACPRKGAQFRPQNSRNSSRSGGRKWLMGGECRDSVVVYPEIGETKKGNSAREWPPRRAPFPPAPASLFRTTWRPR